jgi:hypothetical protein
MLLKTPLIVLLASLSVILPIIVGSITVKKMKFTPIGIIFIYCIVYVFFEIIGWYYVLNHEQNHFLHNTLSYIDILFIGFYFYQILKMKFSRVIVISLITITLILTIWSHLGTGRDFNRVDSFAFSVGNIAIMAMSLLFFYELLNTLDIKNILTYSHFWISGGVLLYFSGKFFTFIFAEYITFSKDLSIIQYFQISDYLLFFQRIFLAIGLWFSKTPPQLSPSSK